MAYEDLETFAELPLTGGDVLRIATKRNNGVLVLDIRRWYEGDDEELHPSPKGVSIPAKLGDDARAALELGFDSMADQFAADEAAATKANGAKKATARKATA